MRYYLESDGRVFLVDRDGVLDLPTQDEIPFKFDEIAPLATSEPVLFCSPHLPRHPHEWPGKDELASLPAVAPPVREAIHAGMPRVVVEGICLKDGKILLVKGSRGLTKGRWSLPGGFLRFGETPPEGLLRELKEELGVGGRIESLLDIKGKLGSESRLHWVMIFYQVSLEGETHPDPDEIAEVAYFPLEKARDLGIDDLMRDAVSSIALSTGDSSQS